jgi:hypothetical protein
VVKPREPTAQCRHDFGEKELRPGIFRDGQHKKSPPRRHRIRTYRLRQQYCL